VTSNYITRKRYDKLEYKLCTSANVVSDLLKVYIVNFFSTVAAYMAKKVVNKTRVLIV